MPVLFTNLLMLAALTALAVPVLIHLLLKRKKKRQRFSTIQFFQKQDEQSSQRRKLRNWLLLALRLIIFALLALAFARPYLPKGDGADAAEKKRQIVFILDRSASMLAAGTDGPRWEMALAELRQALGELRPQDRAALVVCAGGRGEVLSGFAPAAVIDKLVSDLKPGFATGDLGDGLQQATRLLSMGDSEAENTIHLISDLQQNSARQIGAYPIPANAELKLANLADLVTPNYGIIELKLDSKTEEPPHVAITSFNDEDAHGLEVQLEVDGKVAWTKQLALAAGNSTNLALSLPPLKPGWHNVLARLRANDAYAIDDTRVASLYVPEPLRVLVLETRKVARSFEEESFFLTAALDPMKDSTNAIPSPFHVMKVSAPELVSRLGVTKGALPCDVLMLPGMKQIPSGLSETLEEYLKAGGGVVFFLGDGMSVNRYNSEFRNFLPAPLADPESVPQVDQPWRIGDYDTNTLMFAMFSAPQSGNLRIPEFTRRFTFAEQELKAHPAFFDDGVPLVLVRQAGNGKVALVNSSADTAWNDWPKHKTYVPWLHGLAKSLASRPNLEQSQPFTSLEAGADPEIDLGKRAMNSTFQLHMPDGRQIPLAADGQGVLRDLDLERPGLYTLRDAHGKELRRFAINAAVAESDLTSLSMQAFQQQVARAEPPGPGTLTAGLFGASNQEKELWRLLLLAALLLLFVEVAVANRTSI
jgi:hypothetical protein